MSRYLPLVIVLLVLCGLPAVAAGQAQVRDATAVATTVPQATDCPADLACVEYAGHVFELDPGCGPVIGLVIVESVARTISLEGTQESVGLRAVVFLQTPEGGYTVGGEVQGSAAERFDDARFGSVGCMVWEGGSDDEQ